MNKSKVFEEIASTKESLGVMEMMRISALKSVTWIHAFVETQTVHLRSVGFIPHKIYPKKCSRKHTKLGVCRPALPRTNSVSLNII